MKKHASQMDRKMFSSHTHSLIRIVIAGLLICALGIPCTGIDAHAAASAKSTANGIYLANDSSMVFNSTYYFDSASIYETNTNSALSTVTSEDPQVAAVSEIKTSRHSETYVLVSAKKAGTTYITITDVNGLTTKMMVTVTKGYLKKNFQSCTSVHMNYGDTTNTFYTKPYAKVRFTLADNTRTKTADKSGTVVFKTNKIYKIGQEYTVKVYWQKMKLSIRKKISPSSPNAYYESFQSCKSYVPYYFTNVTKGDKVTMYIGSEKHSCTVPYTTSRYYHTFYTKHKMSNYHSMSIKIKNKYNQKLYSHTFAINW
jgi:hypothetical protein